MVPPTVVFLTNLTKILSHRHTHRPTLALGCLKLTLAIKFPVFHRRPPSLTSLAKERWVEVLRVPSLSLQRPRSFSLGKLPHHGKKPWGRFLSQDWTYRDESKQLVHSWSRGTTDSCNLRVRPGQRESHPPEPSHPGHHNR